MTVYFAEELKKYVDDPEAMQAVAKLISQVKEDVANDEFRINNMISPAVEKPVIVNLIYIPYEEINDFAKNAYLRGDVGQFSYVESELTDEIRESYIERAYQEDKIDFFCILADDLPQEKRDEYGWKCYEEDKVGFFCMLTLSEETRQEIRKKAKQDNKIDFYYILED